MKFSLSWLKDYLETEATIEDVADCLNRIGLEVEGIENPVEPLRAFRIAKVLKANPHPQADKLQVLIVDAGDGPVQVVCGAPNARAGMTGIFGPAGAIVPANGMELKVAAIRGEQSNGMMCSLAELALGDDHDGIAELPDDAPKGASYAIWAGLDDPVIDVAITPNRQDCMGVYGIARDLAAAGLGKLKPLKAPVVAGNYPCPVEIRTDDPDGCPAFYGRVVKGVTNGTSPAWMQARLKSAGQRPISALVDITNYVMLGVGRPSHAYDVAKLTGAVIARRAKDGEQVMALNDKVYALTSDMTVIADDAGVHDIAGIMGGAHSGCSDTTTDVLLEIAYFTPEHIARTGQKLALTSDARTRFERGVDPGFMGYGLELVTELILEICGGVASEVVKAGEAPLELRSLTYDPALCAALGGIAVEPEEQKAILTSLGFHVGMDWKVTVPSWRRDIDGPADLVEEGAIDPAPACGGRGHAHRHAATIARTQGSARGSSTRAERGDQLVLPAAKRGRCLWRRRMEPRQSDFGGHEGYAALAAAGAVVGGAAQYGPRRILCKAVRNRAALSGRQRAADGGNRTCR
jgi:phenylalanyl-tRNA synthetase beta chain